MAKDTSYGPDPQDMLSLFRNKKGNAGPAAKGAGGAARVKASPMFSSASASDMPAAANLGGRSGMGTRAGTPARVNAPTGATTGSITKPDKASAAASKARGDAYLANTDYGVGSAVNDFVGKKKR